MELSHVGRMKTGGLRRTGGRVWGTLELRLVHIPPPLGSRTPGTLKQDPGPKAQTA